MTRPPDARRTTVADALRAGYRYLHWAESYRPRFCARLRPTHVRDRRSLTRRLERLAARGFDAVAIGPLVVRRTPRAAAASLEPVLAASARLRLAVVVVVLDRPDAGTRSDRDAWRRLVGALAPVLVPHRHRVIVQLFADPRPVGDGARHAGAGLAPALDAWHGLEAWIEERVADLRDALRRCARPAHENRSSLLATVGCAPIEATAATPQRLLYRAAGATTADVGVARAATVAALASVVHDRPCLATAISAGGSALALGLLLGQAVVTVGSSSPSATRLSRFVRRVGAQWTDPAQEPVAVLIAEGAILGGDTRALAALQRAVWILHARLRLAARTASELDPLALDKQQLIVVPSPQRLTDQGWSLLRHQMARGKTVLLTGPAERDAAGRIAARLAALGCQAQLAPVRANEMLTLEARAWRLRFSPSERHRVERLTLRASSGADDVALHEIPVGQGRLLFCPLPIERATAAADPAIARVYRQAAARASLAAADAPIHDGRRFWRELRLGGGTLTGLVDRRRWRLWFTRTDGTVVRA